MSELVDIADTFKTSKPVFKVTIDSMGDLNFEVKDKYQPPESDDPVVQLVAGTYHENLDKKSRRFISSVDLDRAYGHIISAIRHLVINASSLKNPKQSKLYRWLTERNPMYHNRPSVGYIALYRYMIANDIIDTRDDTNPHARNVIAILELMKEKYEQQESPNK